MTDARETDEARMDSTKAPLLEHLIELRRRLIWSILAFIACFAISYAFAENIYGFLTKPLADALAGQNRHMIYTALHETFFTYVKVGMFGGLCLSFPIIAWQIWMFVAPGLYRNEKKAFLPFLLSVPVLFVLGAAFVMYLVLPPAIHFFLSFESEGGANSLPIELQARVSDYLNFVMALIFAFGVCFQLPMILTLLGRVGILSSAQLRSARRYAIVGIFAVAAVLTPPDLFSQLALGIPMMALYEISILCVWLFERRRAEERAG